MLKRVLASVVGFVVAGMVIFALQGVSHALYPPPDGLDLTNQEAMKAWVAQLPVGALLIVLASYVGGSLVGGFVSTLVAGRSSLAPAFVVGSLLTVMGCLNLAQLPHPIWFAVISTLVYIPCAWLGGRLAKPA